MMRPAFLLFVLILLTGIAATSDRPVRAEAPTPVAFIADNVCPRIGDGIEVCAARVRRRDVRNLHLYARCMADAEPRAAARSVTSYLAGQSTAALAALVDSTATACSPAGRARVSTVLLVGALAEDLLPDRSRVRLTATPAPTQAGKRGPHDTLALAGCLIERNAAESLSLLRSGPASPLEDRRIAGIKPGLAACVPTGRRIETNAPMLRAMIALYLFDRARLATDEGREILAPLPPAVPSGFPSPGQMPMPPAPVTVSMIPAVTMPAPANPSLHQKISTEHRFADLPARFEEDEIMRMDAELRDPDNILNDPEDGVDLTNRRPEAETDRDFGNPY